MIAGPSQTANLRIFREDLRHLQVELARARQSELSEIQKIFDDLFGERVSKGRFAPTRTVLMPAEERAASSMDGAMLLHRFS